MAEHVWKLMYVSDPVCALSHTDFAANSAEPLLSTSLPLFLMHMVAWDGFEMHSLGEAYCPATFRHVGT